MAEPLVSILVTNYNYERFLAAAIESALHQEYGNLEILVLDDGSTDGSLELARSFPVEVVSLEHGGLAAALWEGTLRAKGELLVILNSDDLLHPSFVSQTVAALGGRKRAFAYVGSYLFGPATWGPTGALRMRARRFSYAQLRLGPNMICAGPVPRQAVLEVGGWDRALPVLEDWDFWLRVAQAGYEGVPVDHPLYYYRHHSRQSRNRASRRRNAEIRSEIWRRYGGQSSRQKLLYRLRVGRLGILAGLGLLSQSLTDRLASWLTRHDPFPGPLLHPVSRAIAEPSFDWVTQACCKGRLARPGGKARR